LAAQEAEEEVEEEEEEEEEAMGERRRSARGVGGVGGVGGHAEYFVVLLFFNAPKGNERANASRHPEPANFYSYFMAINFFAVTLASFLPPISPCFRYLEPVLLSSLRLLFLACARIFLPIPHFIISSPQTPASPDPDPDLNPSPNRVYLPAAPFLTGPATPSPQGSLHTFRPVFAPQTTLNTRSLGLLAF
jgi:hypothetical protein